nr:hypothetical protein [Candidatus Sigynarchaeota archaeon]
MSAPEPALFEKWISVKFDGKLVVSATKKDQYVNFKLALIKGKEYTTKLGKAMSVQLDSNDIDDLVAALQQLKQYHAGDQKPQSASAKNTPEGEESAGDLS